ncbi:MAG: ABC transporter permease [Rhodanobacteraceae bacterium]
MLKYYIKLALRSMRRNWIMTALMVVAIGLGTGASMTMLTVVHVLNADPIPGRSNQLYVPHLDPLPLKYRSHPHWHPDDNFTWPDAMALLDAHKAERQAAMSGGSLLLRPSSGSQRPFFANGRYTTADFFAMFDVPFVAGRGWSDSQGRDKARVVVLTADLSRKLFGTVDGTGRDVRLGEHDFRVVGVTAAWHPRPMFYADIGTGAFGRADQFFLPLRTAVDLNFQVSGNVSSWAQGHGDLTGPSTTWLQFWLQLPDQQAVKDYRRFLVNYAAEQKQLGRFERPPQHSRVYSLGQWLDRHDLVPDDVSMQLWLALGFLLVCLVNIVALLLAKFLRRAQEICVRRALGAGRGDIFVQFGIEAALIGVGGGLLGLLLAELGLWSVRQRPDAYARMAHMDLRMLAGTLLLALLASIAAGLLPSWRACRIPPALQLKTL